MAKATTPVIRTRWIRERSQTKLPEVNPKLLVQRQFAQECDINDIVKKARRGVDPTYVNTKIPQFGDFSELPTLEGAYDMVLRAEEAFLTLPAQLRRELNNDPRNIGDITSEQVSRYGLGKESPESEAEGAPLASQSPPAPQKQGAKGKAASSPTSPPSSSSDEA